MFKFFNTKEKPDVTNSSNDRKIVNDNILKYVQIDEENKELIFTNMELRIGCTGYGKGFKIGFDSIELKETEIILYKNKSITVADDDNIKDLLLNLESYVHYNPIYSLSSFLKRYADIKKDIVTVNYTEKLLIYKGSISKLYANCYIVEGSIVKLKQYTPLEGFKNKFEYVDYKLIETEEEFNEFLESDLNIDDWCTLKVANLLATYKHGLVYHEFIKNINTIEKYHILESMLEEIKDSSVLYTAMVRNFGGENNNGRYQK